MNTKYYKYPRTYHIPGSPGATSDDKTLKSLDIFHNQRVIISEKMDGENTTMYSDHYHARSLDSANHPSRNYVKGIWGGIRYLIPENMRICGENVYARHSISYDDLDDYFYAFSIWNGSTCLDYDSTVIMCDSFGLPMPKVLYDGIFDQSAVDNLVDSLDFSKTEGFVIRVARSFELNDFSSSVAKYVRKGHVQTDEHWMSSEIVPNKLKGR